MSEKETRDDRLSVHRTVADSAEDPAARVEALEFLAMKGHLEADAERAETLFAMIEHGLETKLRDSVHDGRIDHATFGWSHPVIKLKGREGPIAGLPQALERWVDRCLIMPSMAAEVLEDWNPSEQFVPILRERIQREIRLKEEAWERDKQARRDNPEGYYYDDRKACACSLSELDRDWQAFYALTERIGGLSSTTQSMKALMDENYYETLTAITDRDGDRIGSGGRDW